MLQTNKQEKDNSSGYINLVWSKERRWGMSGMGGGREDGMEECLAMERCAGWCRHLIITGRRWSLDLDVGKWTGCWSEVLPVRCKPRQNGMSTGTVI